MLPQYTTGLRFLSELGPVTSNPYAQGILGATRLIVESLMTARANDEDLARLATRVIEIGTQCSQGLQNMTSEKNGVIALHAGELVRSLEKLAIIIRKYCKMGTVRKIISSSGIMASIRKAEEELDQTVSIFMLHFQLQNLSLASRNYQAILQSDLEKSIERAQKAELKLIKSKAVDHITRITDSMPVYNTPVAPQIFYGRSDILNQLVGQMTVPDKQSFSAILGPGGIGKTSLALTAFHHHQVKAKFGKYRYFIACDSITDAEGLVAAISQLFQLPVTKAISQLQRLARTVSSNLLLFLDNFETPWEPASNRSAVENILAQLADIPSLSLLVTLRGAERPAAVPWTRPTLRLLQPLDMEAAKQTVSAIADINIQDPSLEELLKLVDCVPLAVTLMATQAQFMDCSSLLRLWNEKKTAMLTRGFAQRLSSLDVSIQVSLSSERLSNTPEGLELLRVIAMLPNGATLSDLQAMTPSGFDVSAGCFSLRQVALVHWDERDRAFALSPVREYVKANHAISDALFAPLLGYHSTQARLAPANAYSKGRTAMIDALTPQIGNLHSVFWHGIHQSSFALQAIQASIDIAIYHTMAFQRSIYPLLQSASVVAEKLGARDLYARCLIQMCHFGERSLDVDRLFKEAIQILRELGDESKLARSLVTYANSLASRSNWPQSIEVLEETLELSTHLDNAELRALALSTISRTLWLSGSAQRADQFAKEGLAIIDENEFPFIASYCYQSLAGVAKLRSLYSQSTICATRSLELIGDEVGWTKGITYARIADSLYLQSRLAESSKYFILAHEVYAANDQKYSMAMQILSLAAIDIARHDYDSALAKAHACVQTLTAMKTRASQAIGIGVIGAVHFWQQNFITAWSYYLEARNTLREARLISGDMDFAALMPMGDILFRSGRLIDSINYYVTAGAICCRCSNRLGVAQCIQRLGDVYFAEPDGVSTAQACYETTMMLIKYLGVRRHIAECLLRLGMCKLRQGDIAASESFFCKSKKWFADAEDSQGEQFCSERILECKKGVSNVSVDVQTLPPATTVMYQ